MTELRRWQQQALAKFQQGAQDFLCVATPGAGKTVFAISAFRSTGLPRLIVVVPTNHLRKQWALAAHGAGIELDSNVVNGHRNIALDMDGAVVTYHSVASDPGLWERLSREDTLVVLDEVHHAGDHLTWGDAIREAFGGAARRLLLSGTPFRHDDKYIPFVTYKPDDKGAERCAADHEYGYWKALQDQVVVRPVMFPVWDGATRYERAGQVYEHESLAQLKDDALSAALRTAFSPDGQWIPSVFEQAHKDLTQRRQVVPDAGGLVLAPDKETARDYARIMTGICGQRVPVATSDEAEASRTITAFERGSAPWLVAVRMVSEGVDIKRLEVGVYASTYKTELFFRQAAGRFVRKRGAGDRQQAALYIPKIEPLVKYANAIEDEVIAARKALADNGGNSDGTSSAPVPYTFLGAGEGSHTGTIFGALDYDPQAVREFREEHDLADLTDAQVISLMRKFGSSHRRGMALLNAPVPDITLADQKKQMKKDIQRGVFRVAKKMGVEPREVHTRLNIMVNEQGISEATEETLRRRQEILAAWQAA
jgi:superfamily II DNA or RNA helicase